MTSVTSRGSAGTDELGKDLSLKGSLSGLAGAVGGVSGDGNSWNEG